MSDIAQVLEIIKEQFSNIQDLGDGLFRCERSYREKVFAILYFDISDNVVERANNLHDFQEEFLGTDFFKADVDRRWNNYLYFWAGPKSKEDNNFLDAKSFIEKDRHFARKFVFSEDELLNHLCSITEHTPNAHISEDASIRWGELLFSASLGIVLEQLPRTQVIELISSGEAFVTEDRPVSKSTSGYDKDPLIEGVLRNLRVEDFRLALNNKDFSFSNINLIFGQNGAGKTSLLESIEALYCGRIRRDSDAELSKIQGQLEMPNGSQVVIKTTTAASVIKERNLNWYGRSNQRSSAITNSFTRFNFLDTDAAFRLANDKSTEDIKEDLSLLLVGPEASSLWTYITKLNKELTFKYSEVCQHIPYISKNIDSLSNELKRLQELPSESTTLVKTYRASLQSLGIKWKKEENTRFIDISERKCLEYLLRGFRQAISIAQSTPVTKQLLQNRQELVIHNLDMLNDSVKEYEAINKEILDTKSLIKEYEYDLQQLKRWIKYCDMEAPIIQESIAQKTKSLSEVRRIIGSISIDEIDKVSEKYGVHSIQLALKTSAYSLECAIQNERSVLESLEELVGLEKSLDSLRSELGSTATSIIDSTGDLIHCPICMTTHKEFELLQKIEALTFSETSPTVQALREAAKLTKIHAEKERSELKSLQDLQNFADINMFSNTVLVGELLKQLSTKNHELSTLNDELSNLQSKYKSLSLLGIDWDNYELTRDIAIKILGKECDVSSSEFVDEHIVWLNQNIDIGFENLSKLNLCLTKTTEKAVLLSMSMGVPEILDATPLKLLTIIERIGETLKNSVDFLEEAKQQLEYQNDYSFGNIVLSLEQVINDFDRAYHVVQSELVTKTELTKKTEELVREKKQLHDLLLSHDNLKKAKDILDLIVKDYSLEQATQESLASIHTHVSRIFSKIHAPSEYILRDFQNDKWLVNHLGQAQGVHQVSTGQRAALALSIFLALNLSAESAPQVILIDDPIAHIDDLNALSFIDYLRDLAIQTNKQIFFATADSKLAALFEKKFEFLGKRYKRIVLTK